MQEAAAPNQHMTNLEQSTACPEGCGVFLTLTAWLEPWGGTCELVPK